MLHLHHLLLVGLCAGGLMAQRIDVAIPASNDATLYDDPAGSLSNGGGGSLFLGNNGFGTPRRTLLKFDVAAAVPRGALVISCELQLTVAQSQDLNLRAVGVYPVTAPWSEGTTIAAGNGGNGATAQPGDATWLHRSWPTDLWNTPGGDHAPQLSAIGLMPPSGVFVIHTTTQLIADANDWLNGRRPNHGWLLRTDELGTSTARRLHSRETSLVGVEPILVVGYLPPGTATSIGFGCVGSNGQQFRQDFIGNPVNGTQVTLGMRQGVPFGLGVTLIGLGINPTPINLAQNCSLFLLIADWPTLGWRIFDQNGQTADTYAIPPDPNLNGAVWALQSVGFDPGIARGYVLSNAHLLVFQ